MPRRSQRHRSSTLPYPYRPDGLEFELEAISLDGRKPRDLAFDPGQTHFDVDTTGEDASWKTAKIFGRLHLSEETVQHVFPEPERDDPPARLYVALQCHQTIYRDRVTVPIDSDPTGTHDLKIELDRDEVRGTVELHPYLVRSTRGEHDGPHAVVQNARLASGTSYTAVVDPVATVESTTIDGEEVGFSQADHLPDGDELYYVDFRNEARPKLWINADHPRITDVLQTNGSVGAEPRMRDVILDQITYGVWTQLVVRTATAVDERGEVDHEWQQTVVETFARDMYDTSDATEAALALRAEARSTDDLPQLMTRLDRELQNFIQPRDQLINLMEEGLQI